MVGLVAYWDPHPDYITLMGGAKRWLSSIIFSMEAFGADRLFLIANPKPGINHGYNIQHGEYLTLAEVLYGNRNSKIVALVGEVPDGMRKNSLLHYQHPHGDVLYVIGGDYSDIEFDVLEGYDVDYVHVDNAVDHKNLWSNVVAGIVLRDRYVKNL